MATDGMRLGQEIAQHMLHISCVMKMGEAHGAGNVLLENTEP
jgi:hypothetical protein